MDCPACIFHMYEMCPGNEDGVCGDADLRSQVVHTANIQLMMALECTRGLDPLHERQHGHHLTLDELERR